MVICYTWKAAGDRSCPGPFVDDGEVEAVANFLRQQGEPVYDESVTVEVEPDQGASSG